MNLVKVAAAGGELVTYVESAEKYMARARAANTVRAYRADWSDFTAWCYDRALPSLASHPETVALYVAALADAGRKPATIQRRLAAISKAHSAAGYESPASLRNAALAATWKGIKNALGTAQITKAPVVTEHLRRMLATVPESIIGDRDRALLLFGFAGALRRSELVALNLNDLEDVPEGVIIHLKRSKTDQEGQGRKIAIPYGSSLTTCPVRSLRTWLAVSGITEGPIFRSVDRHGKMGGRLSGRAVANIVKKRVLAIGLNPTLFAGHSLRAGLATSAAIAGVSERAIMNQTGHKSAAMVRRYIRDSNLFRENAAANVGL